MRNKIYSALTNFVKLFVGKRRTTALLTAAVLIYVGYGLAPLLDPVGAFGTAVTSEEFSKSRAKLLEYVQEDGITETLYMSQIGEFVSVYVPMRITRKDYKNYFEQGTPRFSIRYDKLVLVIGTAVAIILALQVSLRPIPSAAVTTPETEPPATPNAPAAVATPPQDAAEVFEREVSFAQRNADLLFQRSTVLLSGGIIMAFVGVAIFYLTLPEGQRDESVSSYLIRTIRSTGALVFLEAIAWFLLRQYRALIEDYKSFQRLAMKRVNSLAAIRLLNPIQSNEASLFLAATLMQEDWSGRLKTGETTEALEGVRATDENFVHSILKQIIERIPKPQAKSDA